MSLAPLPSQSSSGTKHRPLLEDEDQKSRKRQRHANRPPTNSKQSIKRTSRACDLCRTKKNRCDGARPTCRPCNTGGYDCTYGAQVRKRGLPTGYVRILEALWALVFKVIPNSEEIVLKLLRTAHISFDEEEKVVLHSDHLAENESSRGLWAQSTLRQRIDQMIGQLENNDIVDYTHQRQGKLTPPMVPFNCDSMQEYEHWSLNGSVTQRPQDSLRNDAILQQHLLNDDGVQSDVQLLGSHKRLPSSIELDLHEAENSADYLHNPKHGALVARARAFLPHNVWTLVDIYFGFNNSWFPVVHKHEIVRILSSFQDDPIDESDDLALLWAVIAVATAQTNTTDSIPKPIDRQTPYQVAYQLIPNESTAFRLQHIQSLLLLAMADMAKGNWQAASILVGRATRMILFLLEKKSTRRSSELSDSSWTLSKRVLLGTFALDTILSAHLRSLPHLRSLDIQIFIKDDDTGPEEWDQWFDIKHDFSLVGYASPQKQQCPLRALSTFNQYIKLLSILNDAICSSYPRIASRIDYERLLTALHVWKMQLPKHIILTDDAQEGKATPILPPAANLQLSYATVLLYLHACSENIISASGVSHPSNRLMISTTSDLVYSKTFGVHLWQGILQFYTKLQVLISGAEASSLKEYMVDESISPLPVGAAITSLNVRDTRNHSSVGYSMQPVYDEMSTASLGAICNQNGEEINQRAGPSEGDVALAQEQMTFAEPSSLLCSDLPRDLNTHPLAHCPDTSTDLTTDLLIRHSPLDRPHDASMLESLLEELSSTNDTEWNIMSSQFMSNLGFYDNDPNIL